MSYPNAYLRDFVPVLGQILKEKQIAPEKLHLEIIDEESEEKSIFEPVGVDEVLDQIIKKPFIFRCAGLGGQSRHADRGGRYARFGF